MREAGALSEPTPLTTLSWERHSGEPTPRRSEPIQVFDVFLLTA